MKKVPKCKLCDFHGVKSPSAGLMACHWCTHPKALIDGCRWNPMYANEYKISPKWCPLRITERKESL